jgi:integrase
VSRISLVLLLCIASAFATPRDVRRVLADSSFSPGKPIKRPVIGYPEPSMTSFPSGKLFISEFGPLPTVSTTFTQKQAQQLSFSPIGLSASDREIFILKPTQASTLLGACADDLVAYVAISLFAGLRVAELQKLDWSEIDLDSGHIEVTAAKSKTAPRRLVPIAENLRAWLEPVVQLAGPVAPVGLRNRLDDAKEAAGFPTRESNAMRHSYDSYRLAQCQDASKVSLEMGNSPQMVFAYYRELVKPKDAELYWKITPESTGGKSHCV